MMDKLNLSPAGAKQLCEESSTIALHLAQKVEVSWDLVLDLVALNPSADSDFWRDIACQAGQRKKLDVLAKIFDMAPQSCFNATVSCVLNLVSAERSGVAEQIYDLAAQRGFCSADLTGVNEANMLAKLVSSEDNFRLVDDMITKSVVATDPSAMSDALKSMARSLKTEIIERLLNQPAAVETDTKCFDTALHIFERQTRDEAYTAKATQVFELLLAAREAGKLREKLVAPDLAFARAAAQLGNAGWLERISKLNSGIFHQDDTLIHCASQLGDTATMKLALSLSKIDLNNWKTYRAFNAVLQTCNIATLDLMIEAGFFLHDYRVESPFAGAVSCDNVEAFEQLKDRDRDRDSGERIFNNYAYSVLASTIFSCAPKLLKHFLDTGLGKILDSPTPNRTDGVCIYLREYKENLVKMFGRVDFTNGRFAEMISFLAGAGLPLPNNDPKLSDEVYDELLSKKTAQVAAALKTGALPAPRRNRFTKLVKRAANEENVELLKLIAQIEPRPHKWRFVRLRLEADQNAWVAQNLPRELGDKLVGHLVADELESTEIDD